MRMILSSIVKKRTKINYYKLKMKCSNLTCHLFYMRNVLFITWELGIIFCFTIDKLTANRLNVYSDLIFVLLISLESSLNYPEFATKVGKNRYLHV